MKFNNPAPRDCAGVAPQITALFDGEADATQAHEARAHLLSCPACSRLWLDWTRYRDTFQREPAPAVPPTLLWRVLIGYRVTDFALPARRQSRLPVVTAKPLRGIEAPLPPRLSAHILARTTRKSNAHVMLTPLDGAPRVAPSPWKNTGRSFSFGRAPLWAVPALALWILMLGRADFNATLPLGTPDSALTIAPAKTEVDAPKVDAPKAISVSKNSRLESKTVALIPVATPSLQRWPLETVPIIATSATTSATSPRRSNVRAQNAVAPTQNAVARAVARAVVPAVRVAPSRLAARTENGLSRAFMLAMNAGQSDLARATLAPRVASVAAPVTPISLAATAEKAPLAQPHLAARPTRIAPVAPRRARRDVAESRVTLAALTSPLSPVRTLSSARVRAAFSDDSMRPRVAHPSANGRRLARLAPDEDATVLRVSRPIAQAPTLREVSFGNADNGPKLDELRSAIDDFRASIASDE